MSYASVFNHQNGKGEKIGSESEIGIFKMNNRKNRIGKKIHIGLTLIDIDRLQATVYPLWAIFTFMTLK